MPGTKNRTRSPYGIDFKIILNYIVIVKTSGGMIMSKFNGNGDKNIFDDDTFKFICVASYLEEQENKQKAGADNINLSGLLSLSVKCILGLGVFILLLCFFFK